MTLGLGLALRPPETLFRVPLAERLTAGGVSVLGIPFDTGSHPSRVGAREGPSHIRAHSGQVGERLRYDYGVQLLDELQVVDCGDLDVTPGAVEEAFISIESGLTALLDAETAPLTLGGDGAVTLPQLRAVHTRFPEVCLLHFDAHTDAYSPDPGQPYTNATTFVHCVREGLVDPARSFHVGLRDTELHGHGGAVQEARDLGYQVLTMGEIQEGNIGRLVQRLRSELADQPIFLSWDMDVFDPSVCPGVVAPTWGGLTVREGLQMLNGLRGLDVVAADINTISPPHDVQGLSGSLAARVAAECLTLFADNPRRRASPGN